MEKSAKAMAIMLLASLLLGLIVIALHAPHRQVWRLLREGAPERSSIWLSNEAYYPAVTATLRPEADRAE